MYFEVNFDDDKKFQPPTDKEWNEIFTADSVSFSNWNFVVVIHTTFCNKPIRFGFNKSEWNWKRISDDSTCQNSMQWTDWRSSSDAKNGNDFEILDDHVKYFGWVEYLVFE